MNKTASKNPDKKIVCIDLFYHHLDYENNPKTEIFRNIVKQIAETCGYDNVYHINGKDIISGMNWFTADLEHPNVRGMEEIAANLTCRLKEIF